MDTLISSFSDIVLEEEITLHDSIKIFESYVRERGLIHSQLESYNYFITTLSHEIVNNVNPVIYKAPEGKVKVYFENLIFRNPHYNDSSQEFRKTPILFPYEARDRNVSYVSQMFIDMIIVYPSQFVHKFKQVFMGNMPVMIRSCLCNTYKMIEDELYSIREDPLDEGGYFVIAGKKGSIGERVLINQERAAYNKVYLFTNRKKVPKFTHYAEIRSSCSNTACSMAQVGMLDKKISVIIQWIPEKNCIPVGILFLALGIKHDDIVNYILNDKNIVDYLIPSLEQSYDFVIYNKSSSSLQDAALEYIGKMGKMFVKDYDDNDEEEIELEEDIISKNAINYAQHLLLTQFFPHVGNDFSKKAYFLGYMVNRLLSFVTSGKKELTIAQDRDHYANKRIQSTGELISILFHQSLSKAINDMKRNCESRSSSSGRTVVAKDYLKSKIISDTLNGNLISNNWAITRGGKAGISKIYDRFNPQMMISQRRRLLTPIAAEGKVTLPRKLHPSSFGLVCIAETPEGKQVGLTKNMTIGAYITIGNKGDSITEIILGLDNEKEGIIVSKTEKARGNVLSYTKIFINGSWECITNQGKYVMRKLKELKSNIQLNPETSIIYEESTEEIRVFTDMGRLVRPLYIVKNGKLLITRSIIQKVVRGEMTWHDLITNGYIEIMDAEEQDSPSVLIATFPGELKNPKYRYTHCEIHPILLYGTVGSLIPYSNTNQSPRNCYQCSMAKQAIGLPGLNYKERNNETQYVLDYPQKPIIRTSVSEILGYDDIPCGQNVVVAIMPFYGYNQEDSIVINKSSAERGLFNTTSYVNYSVQLRPFDQEKEILGIPTRELCHDITGNITDALCTDRTILDGCAEHPDEIRVDMKSYKEVKTRSQKIPYAVAKVGSIIKRGDVVIGVLKFIPEEDRSLNQRPYRNHTIVYNHYDYGQVIKVIYGYDGNGYFFVNVKLAAVRQIEIGDKYCVDEKTEILTKVGWKLFSNLKKDDKVATLANDEELKYEEPKRMYEYDYDGSMYRLKTSQLDMLVTPNHKCYVRKPLPKHKFKLEQADKIIGERMYKKGVTLFTADHKKTFIYQDLEISMDVWLIFFGIWIAKGTVDKIGYIAANKKQVRNAIDKIKNQLKFEIVLTKTDSGYYYKFHEKRVVMCLSSKFLPEWCFELEMKQSQLLLENMMLGSLKYYTSSKIWADDFQRLALHAGWNADITFSNIYVITLRKECIEACSGIDEFVHYKGKIYCCETTSGLIYVRRNGKGYWTGNSSRYGQKGTCGLMVRQEDLPFSPDPFSAPYPDLIINPLCIPSQSA